MLNSVTQYLERIIISGKSKASYDDAEVSEAVASIFKQMVLADGVVKKEEISTAVEHLVSDFSYLDASDQDQSIIDHFGEAKGESLFAIAAVINNSLSKKQRKQLKVQLMATALSDNEFHPYEQDFMELVEKLIKN